MSLIFSSDNLLDSLVWTPSGSPTPVDDQHNPLAAYDWDGIDDEIEASSVITSGTEMSAACWFKAGAMTEQGSLIQQYNSNAQGQFLFRLETDGRINLVIRDSDGSNTFQKRSLATFNNDVWRYGLVTGKSGSINLYVDGSPSLPSEGTGTFTSFGTTPAPLTMGRRGDGNNNLLGISARPRIWDTALSYEEALEQYNNEVASIGEGFATGILDPILDPIFDPISDGVF